MEQSIKAKIEAVGTPLKDWDVKINRGILTGCNEAFIIGEAKRAEILGSCKTNEEREMTAQLIRPILRGKDIKRYGYEFADLYVILAYYGSYKIIPTQYPAIYEHLKQYEEKLRNRGQCRYTSSGKPNSNAEFPGQHHWLELDNNPRQDYLDDFSKQKIVWPDLMRIAKNESNEFPRFALIREDVMFTNTTYFLVGTDIEWLFDVLNSKIAAYYFLQNVTMFDNGGLRMFRQFIEEFPVAIKSNAFELFDIYGFSDKEQEYMEKFVTNRITEIQNR